MDKHLTIWLYRRCSFYTIWLHRVHPQHCSADSVNVRKVRHFALSSLPCGVQHYRRHQKVAVPMEAATDQHHYHHAVRLMRIRCDFVWRSYAEVGNRSKLVAVVEITIPFRRVILLVEISYFVPFYYQWLLDTRTQTHSDTHNNVCIFIASALKFALTDKFLFDFCFGFVFVFTYWFVFQSFRVCARTLLFFCFSLSSFLILFPF